MLPKHCLPLLCAGGKEKAALCASNLGSGSSSDDAALLALGPMVGSLVCMEQCAASLVRV